MQISVSSKGLSAAKKGEFSKTWAFVVFYKKTGDVDNLVHR